MTSFTLTLPASFDPGEFLPPSLCHRADDARWLMSMILRKTADRDLDQWGCARLHSEVLRRVMRADCYAKIVRALVGGGAIEVANHYAGVKSKGYRLAQRYLGDRCVRLRVMDPRLIDRIERERDRQRAEEQRTRWQPIHFKLQAEQEALTIDPTADAILGTLPRHTRLCQDVLVSRIQRGELSFSVSDYGRVFNSLTGLKRELRQALRLDGDPMASVDIVACQPALLAYLLSTKDPPYGVKPRATYKVCPVGGLLDGRAGGGSPMVACVSPVSVADDVLSFSASVSDGSFYDRLASLSGLSRRAAKKRFMVDVLAKKGRYDSEVENAFQREYPTVYRAIRTINREDHGELIRTLQRTESWLVIGNVAPRLLASGTRIVTLHDAVFGRAVDVGLIEQAFQGAFREWGLDLQLKRETAMESQNHDH